MLKIKQIEGLQLALDSKLDDSQLLKTVDTAYDPTWGTVSDESIASQKMVKDYIVARTSSLATGMNYRGVFDAGAATSFGDLGPCEVGDFFYISTRASELDGINLEVGDMIIVNTTVTAPVAADIDKIDNTERADILRTSDLINDDTFATATDSNIPTADSVKNYVTNVAGTKEDSFTESVYTYTHSGGTNAVNNPLVLTLPNATKTGFALSISMEGLELLESEYSHTTGTTGITVTLPYTVENGEIIRVIYKY